MDVCRGNRAVRLHDELNHDRFSARVGGGLAKIMRSPVTGFSIMSPVRLI
jgi:hypothetical protein